MNCGTCHYWKPPDPASGVDVRVGNCYRNPPVAMAGVVNVKPSPSNPSGQVGIVRGVYVPVAETEVCGQHYSGRWHPPDGRPVRITDPEP